MEELKRITDIYRKFGKKYLIDKKKILKSITETLEKTELDNKILDDIKFCERFIKAKLKKRKKH